MHAYAIQAAPRHNLIIALRGPQLAVNLVDNTENLNVNLSKL